MRGAYSLAFWYVQIIPPPQMAQFPWEFDRGKSMFGGKLSELWHNLRALNQSWMLAFYDEHELTYACM